MVSKEIKWSSDGSEVLEIEPHTKAKHQVLEEYLKNWIVTLCGNNIAQEKTITIIDGFCGGGIYIDKENKTEWEGSPIRMIKIVEEALEIVKTKKSKPDYRLNFKFIFIDHIKEHIECLKLQITKAGLQNYVENPELCEFIHDEFEKVVDRCIDEVKKRKGSSFWFLDPFGYTDVLPSTIRKIINLKKSEILWNFMIDYIKRFLKDERLGKALQTIEAGDYFSFADIENFDSIEQKSYIRNELLRLCREKCQVPFIWTFALMPKFKTVLYYLVHLSSHPTALKVMKETLWIYNNLEYQYHFNVWGMGFRTPDFYNNNLKIFDILGTDSNIQKCLEDLTEQIIPIVYTNQEGISFKELWVKTLQTNPANRDHYVQAILQQRDEQEVQILRNGKITKANQLESGDIIIKSKFKQLYLF